MTDLITTDQIQYWMECDGVFVRVTEDNAFDPSTDLNTYDPKYKDRINQPSYVTGKKTTIDMDIDLVDPGVLQAWLLAHEDGVNVATRIARVMMFAQAAAAWAATHLQALGDEITDGVDIYVCTQAGTTGSTAPTWSHTGSLTDGTAKWTYVEPLGITPIGSGYAAKVADFTLTQKPVDGKAGEAARATGTLSMTSDGWASGTFDPETAEFTAAV
jgi:hypothetical protein